MGDNIKDLSTISNELGLEYYDQDWGIVNGTADRFVEFVAYFEQLNHASNHVRMEFFELIISSYNELLLEKKETDIKSTVFNAFVSKHSRDNLFKPIVRYWAGIANDDEFPVGYFLLMRKPSVLADADLEKSHESALFSTEKILYGSAIVILTIPMFFKELLSDIIQQNWWAVIGLFLLLIVVHALANRKK